MKKTSLSESLSNGAFHLSSDKCELTNSHYNVIVSFNKIRSDWSVALGDGEQPDSKRDVCLKESHISW